MLFRYFIFCISWCCLVSCRVSNRTIEDNTTSHTLEEQVIDISNIGKKGHHKLVLQRFRNGDSTYVHIRFYEKQNGKWIRESYYEFEKDPITAVDVKLTDYNNDGYNDLSYVSAVAARGANEVRKMFIFNPKTSKLEYIHNSEDYPNLIYNSELDCLDAFMVYGGTTQVFLKIESDSLRKFAAINTVGYRIEVIEIDVNGNEKVLLEDSVTVDELYTRYSSYFPLKEYKE